MSTVPSAYKDLLEKKAFASLATVNADGTPQVTWRETYPNVGVIKPGQTERGSGNRPSGDVSPSSPVLVCRSSAFTTSSAPQMPHGDVVHT